MGTLRDHRIVPINSSSTPLTESEIQSLSASLPAWELIQVDGEARLQRLFRFKDFAQALAFTNRVAALAEAENHHPSLLTEWGRVTVTWWTHAVHGLHANDFIMGARTDAIFEKTLK